VELRGGPLRAAHILLRDSRLRDQPKRHNALRALRERFGNERGTNHQHACAKENNDADCDEKPKNPRFNRGRRRNAQAAASELFLAVAESLAESLFVSAFVSLFVSDFVSVFSDFSPLSGFSDLPFLLERESVT
jgi:hypothetical protein